MIRQTLWDLVVETITAPQNAAPKVLAYQPKSGALWTALLLVAVLNGILYSLLLAGGASRGMILPAMLSSPMQLTMFIGARLGLIVFTLASAGRVLGGQGDVAALLRVTIWLQSLRLALQLVIVVLSALLPLAAWLLAMATMFWGAWIMVNFVAAAHRISVLRAVGVLALSFVGVIVALSILLPILGVTPPGEI
jgi:hypothetical protein